MASYRAIAATGAALAGLIDDRYPRDEFDAVEVKVCQAKDFEKPIEAGFTVFMYRVTVNGSVRNRAHRIATDGRRFLPTLPVDLHFLITPWAIDAERQLRMLGWVMRLMEDIGQLGSSHLNHYLGDSAPFAANEALDVICDPLPLTDYLSMWERLKSLPPSATYLTRMVLIDSEVETAQGAPVTTRRFAMGEVVA